MSEVGVNPAEPKGERRRVELNTRQLRVIFPLPVLIAGIAMLVNGTATSVNLVLATFGVLLVVGSIAGFVFVLSQKRQSLKRT